MPCPYLINQLICAETVPLVTTDASVTSGVGNSQNNTSTGMANSSQNTSVRERMTTNAVIVTHLNATLRCWNMLNSVEAIHRGANFHLFIHV